VIAERAEKAARDHDNQFTVFRNGRKVIPNARLCKACWTASPIAPTFWRTGTESYRFRRTAEKRNRSAKTAESKKQLAVEMTAGDRLKAPPNPQHPKVGQLNRRSGPKEVAKRNQLVASLEQLPFGPTSAV